MVQTISVKDIAMKILRPGETMESAINRVKNWTREGLIRPVGDRHPGTGRARQYHRRVLFEAALLQVLVDCTGIGAISAGPLLDAAKKKLSMLSIIKSDGDFENTVLLIGRSMGVNEFYMDIGPLDKLPGMLQESGPCDTHTIVNLKLLLDRVLTEKA
jgi:hypothetical protein